MHTRGEERVGSDERGQASSIGCLDFEVDFLAETVGDETYIVGVQLDDPCMMIK